MRSLVLDIRGNNWGAQAWSTKDEKVFWDCVWKTKGDLIIVDEGSSTIARNADLIPAFNQIRHNRHDFMVVCHRASNLLPDMRQELNELFLFVQTESALALWREDFPDMQGLEQCLGLKQYEFIHCKKFSTAQKKKLSQ